MITNKDKVLALAMQLKITVIQAPDFPFKGQWSKGKKIHIRNDATPYTILHEIGHVICGYACCREHCEYMAHGAALALAKILDIKLTKQEKQSIDVYAGFSSHKSCGAIEQIKNAKKM